MTIVNVRVQTLIYVYKFNENFERFKLQQRQQHD
jgi:hypothetical protein